MSPYKSDHGTIMMELIISEEKKEDQDHGN